MGAGTKELRGGAKTHVTSDPERERETSVLCHGCRGTPPSARCFLVPFFKVPHPFYSLTVVY